MVGGCSSEVSGPKLHSVRTTVQQEGLSSVGPYI